jgi:hypothetical protein
MMLIATDNLVNNTINQIKIDYDLDDTNLNTISTILSDTLKNIQQNIQTNSNLISQSDNNYFQSILANMIISFFKDNIIDKQTDFNLTHKQTNDFAHLCVSDLNDLYTCVGGAADHCELISIFKKIAHNKLFNKQAIYQLFVNDNEFISLDDSASLDQDDPMFHDIHTIVHQNLIKILPNYLQLFGNDNDNDNDDDNDNDNDNDNITELESLKNEIVKLKTENDLLEERIRDIIPIEHQCCICFGYTHKQQVCVPCGHTQYCTSCIQRIDKCALCNTHITNIVKLYG